MQGIMEHSIKGMRQTIRGISRYIRDFMTQCLEYSENGSRESVGNCDPFSTKSGNYSLNHEERRVKNMNNN